MKLNKENLMKYGKPIQVIKEEVNNDFLKIKEEKNESLFEE